MALLCFPRNLDCKAAHSVVVLLRFGVMLVHWNVDILFSPALQLLLCFSTLVSKLISTRAKLCRSQDAQQS